MRFLKLISLVLIAFILIFLSNAKANYRNSPSNNSDPIYTNPSNSPSLDDPQPNKMLIPVIEENDLSPVDKISEPNFAEDKLIPGLPVIVKVEVIKRSQQTVDASTIALTPESKSKIEKAVDNLYYKIVKNDSADSLTTNKVYQRGEIRYTNPDPSNIKKSNKCADVVITGWPRNIIVTKVFNDGCQLFSHEFLVKNDEGDWNTLLQVFLEIDGDPL